MKELEDHQWFPQLLRNYQTEYIGYVVSRFQIYQGFIELLKKTPNTQFDLCSGSGEPACSIFKQSGAFTHLTLSDKFPHKAFKDQAKIRYLQTPLDVLNMEFERGQTYTMFNAFHHFTEQEQVDICQKISEAKASAYFVEILFPTPIHVIKTLFATTLGVLVLSPWVKPFSWKRLFFTYLIPINPITISIDGFVSVLKSKSLKQYKKLLQLDGSKLELFKTKHLIAPLLIIKINESH